MKQGISLSTPNVVGLLHLESSLALNDETWSCKRCVHQFPGKVFISRSPIIQINCEENIKIIIREKGKRQRRTLFQPLPYSLRQDVFKDHHLYTSFLFIHIIYQQTYLNLIMFLTCSIPYFGYLFAYFLYHHHRSQTYKTYNFGNKLYAFLSTIDEDVKKKQSKSCQQSGSKRQFTCGNFSTQSPICSDNWSCTGIY